MTTRKASARRRGPATPRPWRSSCRSAAAAGRPTRAGSRIEGRGTRIWVRHSRFEGLSRWHYTAKKKRWARRPKKPIQKRDGG
eukprot:6090145-Pyramimonas_sp.AAC.1